MENFPSKHKFTPAWSEQLKIAEESVPWNEWKCGKMHCVGWEGCLF